MAKIFLSYSNDSKDYAKELNGHLLSFGHQVWWFDENIPPGASWQEEILKSISDVDVLVLIVSERSLNSSWINHEMGAAVAYSRERKKPLIIPVVIENVTLPINISQYQAIYDLERNFIETAKTINKGIESFVIREKAEKDQRKEIQQQVESSAASFISTALKDLTNREKSYKRTAYFWYTLSYLTLLLSVIIAFYKASSNNYSTATTESIIQTAIIGLILLGLLITLAKYSFTLGKSFMVESIRNADRRHAISFGEFYLKAFGEQSTREEIRNVFKDWNIDKGSFFINQQSADLDPHILKIITDVAKKYSEKK